jgi:hypothetical protein
MPIEVRLTLEDTPALSREYESNLKHGRAHVPVIVSAERTSAAVLLIERVADGAVLSIPATIAAVFEDGPMRGTVLELVTTDEAKRAQLARFAAGGEGDVSEDETAEDLPTLDFAPAPSDAHSDEMSEADQSEDDEDTDSDRATVDPKIVRIRKLGITERLRLARDGQLEDRVMLERVYSKLVWEDLLRNPGISVPEVARIANKGTAPRHLLELIADNQGWSRQSIVRRALLSNPRIGHDAILKLLRMTPKPELKMITQGTAYPLAVRGAAKKLLDD